MVTILAVVFFLPVQAQTLGGSAVYNFLNLPATPLLTAAGGVNVSYRTNEVGTIVGNPAFLGADMHSQMNASFNAMPGGTGSEPMPPLQRKYPTALAAQTRYAGVAIRIAPKPSVE